MATFVCKYLNMKMTYITPRSSYVSHKCVIGIYKAWEHDTACYSFLQSKVNSVSYSVA